MGCRSELRKDMQKKTSTKEVYHSGGGWEKKGGP